MIRSASLALGPSSSFIDSKLSQCSLRQSRRIMVAGHRKIYDDVLRDDFEHNIGADLARFRLTHFSAYLRPNLQI